MTHDDDALRARMRAGDPAADLPPADPGRVSRLLEDVLMRDHDAASDARTESRETGARGRSPLTWLVAAAAVALIAAAGAFAVVAGGGDDPAPPPAAEQPGTVTELTLPDRSAAARCMVPQSQVLGHAAVAVDAEVASVADGVATLNVSQWYAGEETAQVTVDQSSADRQALIGAPVFEPGERYLVAATGDRQVMVCGYSDRWSGQLAGLYQQAFPQ